MLPGTQGSFQEPRNVPRNVYTYPGTFLTASPETGWSRERRGRREKVSGSIGFRGAGNSGPETGFDQAQFKSGDWRQNGPTVKVGAGLEHMRHA